MPVPEELSWMDAAFLGSLTFLLLGWIQMWKEALPENKLVVRTFGFLSAVGLSYLLSLVMKTTAVVGFASPVVYAVAAFISSNLAYTFLSSSKSEKFSLPSQSQLRDVKHIGGPTEEELLAKKELEISKKKEEILAMFKEMEALEKRGKG
jgi:hypothetical protein